MLLKKCVFILKWMRHGNSCLMLGPHRANLWQVVDTLLVHTTCGFKPHQERFTTGQLLGCLDLGILPLFGLDMRCFYFRNWPDSRCRFSLAAASKIEQLHILATSLLGSLTLSRMAAINFGSCSTPGTQCLQCLVEFSCNPLSQKQM